MTGNYSNKMLFNDYKIDTSVNKWECSVLIINNVLDNGKWRNKYLLKANNDLKKDMLVYVMPVLSVGRCNNISASMWHF